MNVWIGIATAIITLVGLWLAYSYHRQMKLKLSQTRLEAYSRLWEITGVAAPTRLDAWGDDGYLRTDERCDLWAAMTDWYYGKGGGMLLTDKTKGVYLNVKHNLVCNSSLLRPDGLCREVRNALGLNNDQDLDERVRGTLAIRLISLLRTQLKSDLTIYGSTYSGKLAEYERLFLKKSGVKLYSKAWATASGRRTRPLWLLRLWVLADMSWKRLQVLAGMSWKRVRELAGKSPDERSHESLEEKTQESSKDGRPRSSPLLNIPTILSVKGTPRTPSSSRIAMRNAISGSVGQKIDATAPPKSRR